MQQINNQARVEDSGKKHKEKLEGSSFDICWPRKYEKEKNINTEKGPTPIRMRVAPQTMTLTSLWFRKCSMIL